MSDPDFEALVVRLREAGSTWFRNSLLLDLETLIAEARRARSLAQPKPESE